MNEAAKDFLQKPNYIKKKIENKAVEIEQWRDLSENISGAGGRETVHSSNANKDKIGAIVSNIVDLEKELDGLIQEYAVKKRETIQAIEKMPNLRLYDVLFKIYIEDKTLYEVACELKLSYTSIKRMHRNALDELEKQLMVLK